MPTVPNAVSNPVYSDHLLPDGVYFSLRQRKQRERLYNLYTLTCPYCGHVLDELVRGDQSDQASGVRETYSVHIITSHKYLLGWHQLLNRLVPM